MLARAPSFRRRIPAPIRALLSIPLAALVPLAACVSGVSAQDTALRPPDRVDDPTISPEWEDVRLVQVQDDEQLSVLTVTGQAEVEVEPDRARIQLAVETEGETAEQAGELNAALMNGVMAAVRDATGDAEGFRIETFGYSLSPRYGPTQGDRSREIVGYTARNTLQVTLDEVDRVGALIDAALEAGANRVSTLIFEVSEPEPYRHEAIQEAIRSARSEAEVMAGALGMELGRPIEVQGGADVPFPRPFYSAGDRAMEMAAAQAPTPVEAGLQTVSANVTIRFRLEPSP